MAEALDERHLAFVTPGTTDAVVNLLGNASVPANHRYTLAAITLSNTTAAMATVTLARNGTAATAANQIVPAVSVDAHTVEVVAAPIVFETGDSLHALQGTSGAINVDISGADHTLT